jgi:hypothetical protein
LPRVELKAALKVLAGFLAGLALWVLVSPAYDRLIAASAQAVIRAFEDPKVTRLRPAPDGRVTVDRADFDPRSPRPAISLRDLTFNVVLLTALFALSARVFSDRNIGGFLAALAVLGLTHIGGAVAEVMSIYASKLGMWSTVHYSDLERTLWGVTNHFYRLVLMYAIAFGLWWGFRDAGTGAAAVSARKKAKRGKKRN